MQTWRFAAGLGALATAALGLAAERAIAQAFELSADIDLSLGGTLVEDHEAFDLISGAIPVGLVPAGVEVDAYHRYANGDQLYSTRQSFALSGGGTAERADVVRFDGATESLAFDASAQGLGSTVDTDAVAVDGSGDLLLSFDSGQSLGGVDARDEDLVRFDGASFSLFFDGSAQGVPETLDLDAAELRPSDGHLLLSFDAAGEVGGVFFEDEDVLDFDPGAGTWSLAFDGSAEASELALADVIAVPEPSGGLALLFGTGALAALARSQRAPQG
jgi:hypothetical protein